MASSQGDDNKKKKKKNKSQGGKGPAKQQTNPPTIPIAELFPDGNFPEGQIMEHPVGEGIDERTARDSEEKRALDHMHQDLYQEIRHAAEGHRQSLLTAAGTFWMYACFCAIAFFFMLIAVPETKGKSPAEIEQHFRGKKKRTNETDDIGSKSPSEDGSVVSVGLTAQDTVSIDSDPDEDYSSHGRPIRGKINDVVVLEHDNGPHSINGDSVDSVKEIYSDNDDCVVTDEMKSNSNATMQLQRSTRNTKRIRYDIDSDSGDDDESDVEEVEMNDPLGGRTLPIPVTIKPMSNVFNMNPKTRKLNNQSEKKAPALSVSDDSKSSKAKGRNSDTKILQDSIEARGISSTPVSTKTSTASQSSPQTPQPPILPIGVKVSASEDEEEEKKKAEKKGNFPEGQIVEHPTGEGIDERTARSARDRFSCEEKRALDHMHQDLYQEIRHAAEAHRQEPDDIGPKNPSEDGCVVSVGLTAQDTVSIDSDSDEDYLSHGRQIRGKINDMIVLEHDNGPHSINGYSVETVQEIYSDNDDYANATMQRQRSTRNTKRIRYDIDLDSGDDDESDVEEVEMNDPLGGRTVPIPVSIKPMSNVFNMNLKKRKLNNQSEKKAPALTRSVSDYSKYSKAKGRNSDTKIVHQSIEPRGISITPVSTKASTASQSSPQPPQPPILPIGEEVSASEDEAEEKKKKKAEKKGATMQQTNKHTCNVCDKKFTRWGLERHARMHTNEKPYSCNECDKKFSDRAHLRSHTKIHTGDKPYSCNICDKKFARKAYLNAHTRVHTGEKPYCCTLCDKKFSQKGHLNVHVMIHLGEKPYSCKLCDKKFSEKSNLVTHVRVHTGEKPYSCNVCDKKFSQKPALDTHIRIHTGEKPYSCNICDKKFSQQCNLYTHLRLHTGEKPFSCNVCDKNFFQKVDLISHVRVHTGEKPYSCYVCNKKFSNNRSLNYHLRLHV